MHIGQGIERKFLVRKALPLDEQTVVGNYAIEQNYLVVGNEEVRISHTRDNGN